MQHDLESQIRVSDYSECDIRALTEIHMAAYRGYKNAGIGKGYVRAFLRWFRLRADGVALKAEIGSQACG